MTVYKCIDTNFIDLMCSITLCELMAFWELKPKLSDFLSSRFKDEGQEARADINFMWQNMSVRSSWDLTR